MYFKFDLQMTDGVDKVGLLIDTCKLISYASPFSAVLGSSRYSDGVGACVGKGTLNDSRASRVTIQGEMVVPKFYIITYLVALLDVYLS